MQHSNCKLDNTHPKVHMWRNVESPGLNCVHNSSGFLVCVLISTYMYVHLWTFGMRNFQRCICRRTSQSKGDNFWSCHIALQHIWLQRGHQLKGHHQGPTAAVSGQEMRKKSACRIPWSECFTVGLSGSWCDSTVTSVPWKYFSPLSGLAGNQHAMTDSDL